MTNDESSLAETPAIAPAYSLGQLVRYFLQLGAIGLGGPVALMGYMHRDLVERRKWIAEAEYKEGLTLAQLMPRPLAAQLVEIDYGSATVQRPIRNNHGQAFILYRVPSPSDPSEWVR